MQFYQIISARNSVALFHRFINFFLKVFILKRFLYSSAGGLYLIKHFHWKPKRPHQTYSNPEGKLFVSEYWVLYYSTMTEGEEGGGEWKGLNTVTDKSTKYRQRCSTKETPRPSRIVLVGVSVYILLYLLYLVGIPRHCTAKQLFVFAPNFQMLLRPPSRTQKIEWEKKQ